MNETRLGLTAFAALALSACSTVRVEGRGDDADRDPFDPVRPASHCDGADPIPLREVSSGTLFGDTLHVRGVVRRTPIYLSLALHDDDTYAAARLPEATIAEGNAHWSNLGDGRFVRVDRGRLTTLAFSAKEPTVVADVPFSASPTNDFAPVMGVLGSALHLCVTPDGADRPVTGLMDFSNPAQPGELVPDAWNHCGSPELRGVSRDGLYVTSGTEDPTWGTDGVRLFDVALDEVVSDHGWNVSGIHAYGNTREVATDGNLVVATLENPSYVFFYFRDPSAPAEIVYASLGGGKKKLIDVIDGVAYLAVSRAERVHIIAYDVLAANPTHESTIPPTPMDVTLLDASGTWDDVRGVASDASRLVVADAEGSLFVVPLGAESEVSTLPIFDPAECE